MIRYDNSIMSLSIFTAWRPLLTHDLSWLHSTSTNGVRRPIVPLYTSCGNISRRRKAMTPTSIPCNSTGMSKLSTYLGKVRLRQHCNGWYWLSEMCGLCNFGSASRPCSHVPVMSLSCPCCVIKNFKFASAEKGFRHAFCRCLRRVSLTTEWSSLSAAATATIHCVQFQIS